MEVSITANDICDISKIKGGKNEKNVLLKVTFKKTQHKDLFFQHRHKLLHKPEISNIRIHELLDPETQALFLYSQKLRQFNYKIIYVDNNKVHVKKEKNYKPINILSKDQVDSLCVQQKNVSDATSALSPLFEYSQKLKTVGYKVVFIDDNKIFVKKNRKSPRINILSEEQVDNLCMQGSNYNEIQSLFQYSLRLKQYGYKSVFLENKKIFAKKYSNFPRIKILSKEQVDHLVSSANSNQSVGTNISQVGWTPINHSEEIEALLQYSMTLKRIGYREFYVHDNKVFVKKRWNSQPINILSEDHVRNLRAQHFEETSTPNTRNNIEAQPAVVRLSSLEQNLQNKTAQELLQYSQKLKTCGYDVIFVDNKVYADKTNNLSYEPVNIVSKAHVDRLCIQNTEKNRDTEALFEYSKQLERYGYTITCKNNQVLRRDSNHSSPVIIRSRKEVDDLLYVHQVDEYENYNSTSFNFKRHNAKESKCVIS